MGATYKFSLHGPLLKLGLYSFRVVVMTSLLVNHLKPGYDNKIIEVLHILFMVKQNCFSKLKPKLLNRKRPKVTKIVVFQEKITKKLVCTGLFFSIVYFFMIKFGKHSREQGRVFWLLFSKISQKYHLHQCLCIFWYCWIITDLKQNSIHINFREKLF